MEWFLRALSGAGSLCALLFGWAGWRRAERQENRADGQLISDVGYIKSGVDDLKRRLERQEARITRLETEVSGSGGTRGGEGAHIVS